jgi:hypothetical protein
VCECGGVVFSDVRVAWSSHRRKPQRPAPPRPAHDGGVAREWVARPNAQLSSARDRARVHAHATDLTGAKKWSPCNELWPASHHRRTVSNSVELIRSEPSRFGAIKPRLLLVLKRLLMRRPRQRQRRSHRCT